MNVCRIANTRFDRAVDITLEPRSFGDRRDFFGFKNSAGFGGIDRDEIGGFFLDNLYNIGGCPCAFVAIIGVSTRFATSAILAVPFPGFLMVSQSFCFIPLATLTAVFGRG